MVTGSIFQFEYTSNMEANNVLRIAQPWYLCRSSKKKETILKQWYVIRFSFNTVGVIGHFFLFFFLLTWLLLFEIGPVRCICSVSANENLDNISCQFVTGHTPIRGDIIHFDVSELYKEKRTSFCLTYHFSFNWSKQK